MKFVRSSYCHTGGCVDVAVDPASGNVIMRDSKDPDGPDLVFTADEWDAFLAGARAGEFTRAALQAP